MLPKSVKRQVQPLALCPETPGNAHKAVEKNGLHSNSKINSEIWVNYLELVPSKGYWQN